MARAFWLQQAHNKFNSFIAPVQTNDTNKSIFLTSTSSAMAFRTIKDDREHIDSGTAECVKLKAPLSVPAIFAASVRASILIVFALVVRLLCSEVVHISRSNHATVCLHLLSCVVDVFLFCGLAIRFAGRRVSSRLLTALDRGTVPRILVRSLLVPPPLPRPIRSTADYKNGPITRFVAPLV